MAGERPRAYVCAKDAPWKPEYGTPVMHPDAVYRGDRDFGKGVYCERYCCPHCGAVFYVELPQ